jgi:hypothetical protein
MIETTMEIQNVTRNNKSEDVLKCSPFLKASLLNIIIA